MNSPSRLPMVFSHKNLTPNWLVNVKQWSRLEILMDHFIIRSPVVVVDDGQRSAANALAYDSSSPTGQSVAGLRAAARKTNLF